MFGHFKEKLLKILFSFTIRSEICSLKKKMFVFVDLSMFLFLHCTGGFIMASCSLSNTNQRFPQGNINLNWLPKHNCDAVSLKAFDGFWWVNKIWKISDVFVFKANVQVCYIFSCRLQIRQYTWTGDFIIYNVIRISVYTLISNVLNMLNFFRFLYILNVVLSGWYVLMTITYFNAS